MFINIRFINNVNIIFHSLHEDEKFSINNFFVNKNYIIKFVILKNIKIKKLILIV